MKKMILITLLLVSVGFNVAFIFGALTNNPPPPTSSHENRPERKRGPHGGFRKDPLQDLAEQLGLSEEKRGTLEAIRKKYKDRMEELFIKSRETREAIRAELAKDEPDQVKIDALLEAMPSLEILRLTTQENLETMQTLTAEQRKLALEWHKKRDFRRKPPRPKDEKSPKSSANP